jgi:hypothetical protein
MFNKSCGRSFHFEKAPNSLQNFPVLVSNEPYISKWHLQKSFTENHISKTM